MISKLPAVAAILLTCSYAMAGSTAIGTASARGDMRIDGDSVKGNATLFDGTAVETGQATAALRLDKGIEVKLATGSRGTLYRNRVVLQQGSSEFAPSGPFYLEANGLVVTQDQPNSRAVVSMSGPNTVEVAALAGEFRITNDRGLLLAHLNTGKAMSFALQAGATESGQITVEGQLIKSEGHHFIIRATDNAKYELRGKNFFWSEGQEASVTGTLDPHAIPAGGARGVIDVTSSKKVPVSGVPAGIATGPSLVIVGSIAAAGAAIGIAIAETSGSSTPASR
jgi:hypothetical protein